MAIGESSARGRTSGLIGALRQLRDPLLLFVVPVTFALLEHRSSATRTRGRSASTSGERSGSPRARSSTAHRSIREPTRDAVVLGNPAVYPPLFILAVDPARAAPRDGRRRGSGSACSASGVFVSLWILGVRDWRCLVLALTSPVVDPRPVLRKPHGAPAPARRARVALPRSCASRRARGRRRGRREAVRVAARRVAAPDAAVPGRGLGSGLGRRARARRLGRDRLRRPRDYPKLLRAVQDVYAVRSISLSTVAGALGASVSVAVAVAAAPASRASGSPLARPRGDGDRRAFAGLSPRASSRRPSSGRTTPRSSSSRSRSRGRGSRPPGSSGMSPGAGAIAPKPVAEDVCCRPPGVPEQAWGGATRTRSSGTPPG